MMIFCSKAWLCDRCAPSMEQTFWNTSAVTAALLRYSSALARHISATLVMMTSSVLQTFQSSSFLAAQQVPKRNNSKVKSAHFTSSTHQQGKSLPWAVACVATHTHSKDFHWLCDLFPFWSCMILNTSLGIVCFVNASSNTVKPPYSVPCYVYGKGKP